jgi:hypothetical protein
VLASSEATALSSSTAETVTGCVRVTDASERPEGHVVVGVTKRAVGSIALLAAFLLPASGAYAYGVDIQEVFDGNGNPSLVANFVPDGGLATPSWEVCDPGCRPVAPGQGLTPGHTAPATVFRASAEYRGQHYSTQTTPWQGQVTATVRPALRGEARVAALLQPVAGSWAGGWPNDYSKLGVVACQTAAAQRCRTLMNFRYGLRPAVRVPSWATGWYLFATDERFAADTVFPAVGYRSPGSVPPPTLSQVVAFSAPGARVTGLPAPRVRLRKRVTVRHRRTVIGEVRYARACRVHVTLFGRKVGQSADLRLPHGGPIAVRLRQPLGSVIRVSVSVDDGPPVSGRLRAS